MSVCATRRLLRRMEGEVVLAVAADMRQPGDAESFGSDLPHACGRALEPAVGVLLGPALPLLDLEPT